MELDGRSCQYHEGLRSKQLCVRDLILSTTVQTRHIADTKFLILSVPNRSLHPLNIFKRLYPAHKPIGDSRIRKES